MVLKICPNSWTIHRQSSRNPRKFHGPYFGVICRIVVKYLRFQDKVMNLWSKDKVKDFRLEDKDIIIITPLAMVLSAAPYIKRIIKTNNKNE